MKICLVSLSAVLILINSVLAQNPAPPGASKFIKEMGGLSRDNRKPDLLQHIAGKNIDSIEGGGGIEDWTEIDGRIFLTRRWMIEIGKISEGYSTYDLKKSLADAMQKQLVAEGFKLSPPQFDLHSVRYQRGKTVGTVEVRSFFLRNGNAPLRMEFIFNESYLRGNRQRSVRSTRE